jgi:hypothetical protein
MLSAASAIFLTAQASRSQMGVGLLVMGCGLLLYFLRRHRWTRSKHAAAAPGESEPQHGIHTWLLHAATRHRAGQSKT